MKKWTEASALRALNGNTQVDGKLIINRGGFNGLSACSAFDYLRNCHGYRGNIG